MCFYVFIQRKWNSPMILDEFHFRCMNIHSNVSKRVRNDVMLSPLDPDAD
ncbi:hypothetical protein [Perigonia lusca single nucleopolyhedrovirus]|uniref:Uncharacterized protein n=1 Tax=Perigonia lusca single nucleopolyhedrovirus TaxID=1675865 RepID=A0A0M3WP76_9ABAC|nr:hypothetical protein [Perigonia lusca single nucleopolyhedrovirus]AKN80605.1 hypothetical protein [Perigonia lusca single nucleopolyhedrovirus]